MTPEQLAHYPAITVTLTHGAAGVIRPLAPEDAEALAAFYAAVPREDLRFYCPHPLDRAHALRNAANAYRPTEVVLVLETGGGIGGYAWYRWRAGDEKSGFGICIGRACQGRGAGRLLMTRLLEIAKTIGPPVMGLTV
ncbi:MAG TPA: GNAT family N-acetyltransferase, partial [Armatimonadota bacterium]|nr:GNAT family N-acetyltransferase [Armatimonadota bacterium]